MPWHENAGQQKNSGGKHSRPVFGFCFHGNEGGGYGL
jgi:hypothetical protein